MSIATQLLADMKEAMKGGDALTRDTLRMIRTDLGRRELELGRELTDADALEILARAVKTRKESLEQYTQGGRADLAEKEAKEIGVIERYLPQALDEAAARSAIAAIAAELGATTKKDMGRVMKEVTARLRGQVDGKLASKLVGELLA